MSTQWVQHNSGNGKKYQVVGDHEHTQKFCWVVWNDDAKVTRNTFHLPQSEYRLCDPPEVWVDVTDECEVRQADEWPRIMHRVQGGWGDVRQPHHYRLRKVPICTGDGPGHEPTKQWAFIVERKEAQS